MDFKKLTDAVACDVIRAEGLSEEQAEDLLVAFHTGCADDLKRWYMELIQDRISTLRAGARARRNEPKDQIQILSPAQEVKRREGLLSYNGWNGLEIDGIAALLELGEVIERVAVFSVRTSRRTLTRAQIQAALRPVTYVNSSYQSQFNSQKALEDLDAELRRRQAS